MYLGVDIGGTKTLAAALDDHGVITRQLKLPTNHDYSAFLHELATVIKDFGVTDYRAAAVGMPATDFDRRRGVGNVFANLPWKNVPVQADIERLAGCPTAIENDAKLAGLSEAMLLKQHSKVLYITISTGIGIGLVVDQRIDPNIGDSGGANIMLQHHGKITPWEQFASGRAIVDRFGKKAADITDQATWKIIMHDVCRGLLELIALTEPDVIVIGGSVGSYFDRYKDILTAELARYETPLLKMPLLRQAQRPEAAVVYGCYDYARQQFGIHRA